MQRIILLLMLAAGCLVLVTGPASACLWDRETVPHEKQFKSNYLENSAEPSSEGQYEESLPQMAMFLAGGAGLAMLLSGLSLGLVRGVALQRDQASRSPNSGGRS